MKNLTWYSWMLSRRSTIRWTRYLKLIENKLKKDAVIVADNVGIFEKFMYDYLEYVRTSGRYTSITIQTGTRKRRD
jgi:predicted O-methyltransferase YrrM